ncbi:hypothetical protein DM02DRAFT_613651 [Periconia macrospinosa]|uniref:Uncharacterized protein n=1 Tax=Periconia macrospinosa TaxID=97972 RepID=A0A2V1DT80_9PLEO|nr:hypothetical protein DM02DRAFT_613651 [Periconia macrospinosa]
MWSSVRAVSLANTTSLPCYAACWPWLVLVTIIGWTRNQAIDVCNVPQPARCTCVGHDWGGRLSQIVTR